MKCLSLLRLKFSMVLIVLITTTYAAVNHATVQTASGDIIKVKDDERTIEEVSLNGKGYITSRTSIHTFPPGDGSVTKLIAFGDDGFLVLTSTGTIYRRDPGNNFANIGSKWVVKDAAVIGEYLYILNPSGNLSRKNISTKAVTLLLKNKEWADVDRMISLNNKLVILKHDGNALLVDPANLHSPTSISSGFSVGTEIASLNDGIVFLPPTNTVFFQVPDKSFQRIGVFKNGMFVNSARIFKQKNMFVVTHSATRLYYGAFSREGVTEQSLLQWLSQAGNQNKKIFDLIPAGLLNASNKLKKDCVKVQNLEESDDRKLLGLFFDQRCLENGKKSSFSLHYVFKIFKDEENSRVGKIEIRNLRELEARKNAFTQKALEDPIFPIVTSMVEAYWFKDSQSIARSFVVLEAAKGRSLFAVLNDDALTHQEKILASQRVGASLAKFHLAFMDKRTLLSEYLKRRYPNQAYKNLNLPISWWHFYRTLAHRDTHSSNIFYSSEPRVYLIDNSTMGHSLRNPTSIVVDVILTYLYNSIYWSNHYGLCLRDAGFKASDLESNIGKLDEWEKCRDIFDRFTAFLKSYVEQYPLSEQRFLAKYLAIVLESNARLILYSSNTDELNPPSYEIREMDDSITEYEKQKNEELIKALSKYLHNLARTS